MTDIKLAIRIARQFSEGIQQALTVGEFRRMIDANKAEANEGVCHTHDYCDANDIMHVSFIQEAGYDPLGETGMNEADTALWNAAWDIAKAAGFFA